MKTESSETLAWNSDSSEESFLQFSQDRNCVAQKPKNQIFHPIL